MRERLRWPGWKNGLKMLAGSDYSTPNLALAVALGALVAPTPLLGLHTWLAIGLAFVFRVNRLAAFIGSNLANPLTMAPIVWLDIQLGAFLLRRPAPSWQPRELDWEWVRDRYGEVWVGAALLGVVFFLLSYALTTIILNRMRRRRTRRAG